MNATSTGPAARRPWLAVFAAFAAFGAWAGAFGLITGGTDFGDTINNRLPFDSLVLAGLALAFIVGVPLTVLAWSAWTGGTRTDDLALVVGLVLIGWILGGDAFSAGLGDLEPRLVAAESFQDGVERGAGVVGGHG